LLVCLDLSIYLAVLSAWRLFVGLELALGDEVGSELNTSVVIHRENVHSRAADGGETDDERASKGKMVKPFLLSGVK
jgi:hypothetical protein